MNIATKPVERSPVYNVLTTLVGALLMGMLWRVRGTQGWGSSWGLLNAGFIFTLFIISFLGSRKKLGLGWLTITSVTFMLTVPAWGTLLNQITGVLEDSAFERQLNISAFSAVFLMLCLGFGLAVLFGIMLGRAYSDKSWRLVDFVFVLVAFYAVGLLAKATFAHWILELVQPQAGELFSIGLKESGEDGSVWLNYIKHFDNASWAKKICGGRNYFASIKAISSAFSAVAAILTTRFIVKDNRAAKSGAFVCCSFSFAITVSNLFFFFAKGGWHGTQGFALPANVSAWEMWEFATGFIAGGLITAFMLKMKPKEDVDDLFAGKIPPILEEIFTFIFVYITLIGVSVIRPVVERFENSEKQILCSVIAVAVAVLNIAAMSYLCGINGKKIDIHFCAVNMLIIGLMYIFAVYMFVGTSDHIAFNEVGELHNILVIVSFVSTLGWAIYNFIKIRPTK